MKISEIKEEFIHFLWKYKLLNKAMYTTNNKFIEIISPGQHNNDSGPDFIGGKIRIGSTFWVGNIEIHKKSSDWLAHGHQNDPTYDNIILHVVLHNNMDIKRQNGNLIPTLELKSIIDKTIYNKYLLLKKKEILSCKSILPKFTSFIKYSWLETLAISRLESKCSLIEEELNNQNNYWEYCFFIFLCKSFGSKVNDIPFECLARSISLNIIAKHKNNSFQIEALLMGQAGILHNEIDDPYLNKMRKEYKFLALKYNLTHINKSAWKYMRMRPSSFPTIRISLLSNLIHNSTHLFRKCIESKSIQEIHDLLECKVSSYWNNHYTFGKESKQSIKTLGINTKNSIIINCIIPFIFIYSKKKALPEIGDKSLQFLQELPSENNKIIKLYKEIDIKSYNAMHSQGLLHLYKEYCKNKKCLECQFGFQSLRV